ncbi:Bug family tripartite tricarboxylate transporter substrate binding protein [Nitrincola nitratireducens]|uniref:Argininosuccinate lyase n=1 Tax=Nitrincola nitratireducens TaxID=1229521 RepID=W9V942_9GAMM|nr:tripartite tricarboxylate transporter substrate binding protein [Nitrincola nitratireducens]EXJ12597.1 Argininosuccinate lyase [Nitrincola nitratireducens]
MINTVKKNVIAACLLGVSALPFSALSDEFPIKTVSIVVPYNAGGGVDTVARILADNLRESLGRDVIVENKPGGSGMIGANYVAKSNPDGYTLLLGSAGETAINEFVYQDKMQYSPTNDLTPITLVSRIPNVLVISPRVPVTSLDEFIDYAKANPDKLTYASSGIGNPQHLNGEFLNSLVGINMTHIPYQGSSRQMVDVASGDVDLTFVSFTSARGFIEDGKVRAIGVTSGKRAEFDESIPALSEHPMLSDYELENWFGLFAPTGTPDSIIHKINEAVVNSLGSSDLSSRLKNMGGESAPMSVDDFRSFLASERIRFSSIIESANFSID